MMKNCKRYIALAAALLLVAACAAGCKTEDQIHEQQLVSSAAEDASYYDTRSIINVVGEGKVTVEPGMAKLGFRVHANDKDASVAQQKNAELMDAVLEVIRAKGVAEEDISTGGLNIYEVYDYNKNPAKLTSYDVYYSVEITVRDMSVLGSLLSEVVAAGATDITGPEYATEDDPAAYLEALSMAVTAAREKAQKMAESAGVRLSALPISITESSSVTYPETRLYTEAAVAEDSSNDLLETQVVVPNVEVSATVNAVYQITR